MKRLFSIEAHDGADKSFAINGPDGFFLIVDYDDVDHDVQDRMVKQVVQILNAHWERAK